jgi:hypothetical protein
MQSSGSFRLIVRRGPQPNQIYDLNKDIITLGRDITNDIVINDPEVSRHHGRLTRGGGGYTLEDLGSTNGTFVSGQRLTGARPLSGGDVIGLGETVTLSYEATLSVTSEPSQAATMVSPAPAPQPSYQPAPQQSYQTMSNPQVGGTYQPPAGNNPAYQQQPSYSEAGGTRPGVGRWIFLGCGCLIVLCVVVVAAGLIFLSSTHGGCDISLLRKFYDTVQVFGTCPTN